MRRLCTPKWLVVHAGMVIAVVAFLLLGRWQIGRALGGNAISFGYAVEWPVFAGFVVWVWATEVRKAWRAPPPSEGATQTGAAQTTADLTSAGAGRSARARPARVGPAYDDSADPELAAYNRYLEWLNVNPHASPRDYRDHRHEFDHGDERAVSSSHEETR
jgi:hypothetical protein